MRKQRPIIKSMVAAILAVAFSVLFLQIGRGLVSSLVGVDENFYLKYYYDFLNSGEDPEMHTDVVVDKLTIIDIHNYRSRHEIARILDTVYKLNPCVIGLDVYFPDNPDINDTVNTELIQVLKRVQDKTVVATNYNDNNVIYPFFSGSKDLDKLSYASPLSIGYFEHYQPDDSSLKGVDSLSQRMSFKIAKLSNLPLQKYVGEDNVARDFYVNYCKKNLLYVITDISNISPGDIRNKIVLIGDMGDIKDMSRLPFRFGNQTAISGIEDIAYSILSLIRDDTKALGLVNNLDRRMRFRGFADWPCWGNILVSLILAFYFSRVIRWYSNKTKTTLENSRIKAFLLALFRPLWFVLIEFLVVVLFYSITYFSNTIPDLFLSLVAVACVSTSNNLSEIIFADI